MAGIIKVFARGLLAVCGVTLAVSLLWGAYLQRHALAAALAPATDLVNSLRGVSRAPDSEPAGAPRVLAPPVVEPAQAQPTPGETPED